MERKNIIIHSGCDDLPISVTIFIPEVDVKGIFQISHGMAEHKERYYHLMEYLTQQGYVTVINDHRGHGESVKEKEDLGYFYENHANYIVEDLHQVTNYIKEMYPNQEMILLGHSMGSMVVRKYIKKYDKDIDKLIVCGSPSKNPFIHIALCFTKMVCMIKGERYRSHFIQNLAFGNYNQTFKDANSSNSWICANEEIVKLYDEDNLCGFIFTLNGFQNLFQLMKDIYTLKGWCIENKTLPILFIAGSDDPVIMNKDSWIKSQNLLKKIGYTDVQGKLYENLRHEILNEKNREVIYHDILKFIMN